MAGQGVAGFAKTQLQCAEAAGLENPDGEIANVSYNAKTLRQIDAVGCVGVVDQLTSWGYDALAAFQPESEEESEESEEESEEEHEEEHERGTDAGANRRERGGRRRKAAGANGDTEVDGNYRGSGFTFERYRQLVTSGVRELEERIERGEVKYRAANAVCDLLKEKEGFSISSRTLVRYRSAPGSIPCRGGGGYFSQEFEVALADIIRWYRSMNLPVFISDVIEMVYEALQEAGVSDALKDGSVSKGFVQRFIERHALGTAKIQPLEAKRAEWMTAANYKVVFDNWAKIAVDQCGIAERNENFSEDTEGDNMVVGLDLNRCASFDETELAMSQMASAGSKDDRGVTAGKGDDGTCNSTKSMAKATGVFGRIGTSALPPFIIFGGSNTVHAAHFFEGADGEPKDGVHAFENVACGEDGKPVATLYAANPKGAMNMDLMLDYLQSCILPAFRARGVKDEDGKRGLLFFDGVGCHLGYEFVRRAKEAGIECCLRVPNTSAEAQGEDTVLFRVLQPKFRRAKRGRQKAVALETRNPAYQLSLDDLKFALPEAFNLAFTIDKALSAWRYDGVGGYEDQSGFTRTPYWAAVRREKEAARQLEIQRNRQRLQAVEPNTGAGRGGGHVRVPGLEEPGAEEGDDDDDGDDAERAAAREEAAATKPGVVRITQQILAAAEALPSSQSQRSVGEMTTQEIRQELAINRSHAATLRKAVLAAKEDQQAERNGRITGKDLAFLQGSMTGRKGMEMLKDKADKAEAAAEESRKRSRQKAVKRAEREEDAREVYASLIEDCQDDPRWVVSGDYRDFRSKPELVAILTHANRRVEGYKASGNVEELQLELEALPEFQPQAFPEPDDGDDDAEVREDGGAAGGAQGFDGGGRGGEGGTRVRRNTANRSWRDRDNE